jgi:anaerobic magnesium-protoporphyrin IX monomethyl ester cyclase
MTDKVKVALVNPPLMKGVYRHQPYLPINIAYLAAVLEKAEHEVAVMDCSAVGMDHEKLGAMLASLEPNVVGITSMVPTTPSALISARVAKEVCPKAAIVMGGLHATFMDEQFLNEEAAIDIIVRGEGEQTILELADYVSKSRLEKLGEVAGITFRKNGHIVRTPDRAFIQNLDDLPFPAYRYFPLDKYRLFGRKFLPVITSRGCPFRCSSCVTPRMFRKTFRLRSPKNVVDELELGKNMHDAEAFSFYDDTLTFDKKRISEICDEIKNRKLDLPWDCQTRVDKVSKEILAKMREAGCQQILFGVESGCQRVLDAINKETSVEQNEKAVKLAKEAGIFVTISMIIGYPSETPSSLKETIDFIQRVKPDDVCLCVATPYPGTKLRAFVEEKEWKMSSDWSLYDLTNCVFENPDLPCAEIRKFRDAFYDSFYSPSYVVRQFLKRNCYSRIMARTALNHLFWRIKPTMKRREKISAHL